jgi:hypothetical protein
MNIDDVALTNSPEPSTWLLAGLGAALFYAEKLRRRI